MTRAKLLCVLLTVFLLLGGTTAQAVLVTPDIFVSFDESGRGFVTGVPGYPGVPIPLEFSPSELDPETGMHTLLYFPPGPVAITPGYVVALEPPDLNTISDVLHFVPDLGVFVYSDLPEPGEAGEFADVGIPTNIPPDAVRVPEVGPEGSNGIVYVPREGQPGYFFIEDANNDLHTPVYQFTSDVPEPATLLVWSGLGAIGAVMAYRRRRRAA